MNTFQQLVDSHSVMVVVAAHRISTLPGRGEDSKFSMGSMSNLHLNHPYRGKREEKKTMYANHNLDSKFERSVIIFPERKGEAHPMRLRSSMQKNRGLHSFASSPQRGGGLYTTNVHRSVVYCTPVQSCKPEHNRHW